MQSMKCPEKQSNDNRILYTYCVKDDEGVALDGVENKEYETWKEQYKKDLKSFYVDHNYCVKTLKNNYIDPDTTYKYESSFYKNLEKFLTNREEEYQKENKLNGKFQYCFEKGKGIKVSNGKGDEFYLVSDQFGFSVPEKDVCHPYDCFIRKNPDKDDAIEKVSKWVAFSRSIGGSFLWVYRGDRWYYNLRRGGAITSNRSKYIQDRVDLTLWEVYYRYHDLDKNTILSRCISYDDNLDIWLGHFKDFQTFADFFFFSDDTVGLVKEGKEGKPISILTGKVEEPIWGGEGKQPKPEITCITELKKLEEMLDRVNNAIRQRSLCIQDYIQKKK